MVHSPNGDKDSFEIVFRFLQGNTLEPYMFIICLDYVLRTSNLIKENGFSITKKTWSRWYPTEIMTDADKADNLGLLANAPAQAESLLYNLEEAAGDICLNVNVNEIELMRFKQ